MDGGGVDSSVFHPLLVQWHSSDYRGVMVWGESFMLTPWSIAFDTHGKYPPGSRNAKESHNRRRVRRHQKEH